MNGWEFLNNLSQNVRFYGFTLALIIFFGGGWLVHLHVDWFPTISAGWSGIIGGVGGWIAGKVNGNGYTNGSGNGGTR